MAPKGRSLTCHQAPQEYQKKSSQWTIGKNFDNTGAFGPEFVSAVGYARTPPLFMKDGDVCEIEIEGIGVLSNPVVDEA